MTKFILALAIAIATIGCAGSQANEMAAQISMLQQQNAQQAQIIAAQATAASEGSAPTMMLEPGATPDFLGGVPQNVGSLYGPMKACSRGGRSIGVHNEFEPNHIRLLIDGEEVSVLGSQGRLMTLPPGKTVYLCVLPGHHEISGIALEPDGLTELVGQLAQFSMPFSTGAYPRTLYVGQAEFAGSD